jgi:tetratricopeptide (TPR) repeat protein
MSQTLWQELLDLVRQTDWPHEESTSEGSQGVYESGLDLVNSYRGHPDILVEALKQFRACGSAGYAKAGISAVLMTAAYERGDSYDSGGLKAAESYLTEAQQILPDRAEIDHLAAKLCLLRKQDNDARRILDKLKRASPNDFFTASIDLWYWYNTRDIQKARASFEKAKTLAKSGEQRDLIANQMAGCYQTFGDPADAITAFREITAVAPDDPWAWHNLSIQLLQSGSIDEADRCNAKALQLMEFPAAREVQSAICKRKGGFWSWLSSLFRSN